MASNLPVVTTSIGIEGIGAKNGLQVLVSNDQKDIANLSVKLVKNRSLAKEIAQSAHKLVVENYDWGKISTKLDRIYEETAKKN